MDRPSCNHCDAPADYFDPKSDDTACHHCAINLGLLTNSRCWTWNPNRQEFDT